MLFSVVLFVDVPPSLCVCDICCMCRGYWHCIWNTCCSPSSTVYLLSVIASFFLINRRPLTTPPAVAEAKTTRILRPTRLEKLFFFLMLRCVALYFAAAHFIYNRSSFYVICLTLLHTLLFVIVCNFLFAAKNISWYWHRHCRRGTR